jgi:HEAT repeat protein
MVQSNSSRIAAALRNVLEPLTACVNDRPNHADLDDLPTLTRRAVTLLGEQRDLPMEEAVARAVIGNREYYHVLLRPESTDAGEMVHAAAVLARYDSVFTAGLLRAADATARSEGRALEILDRLGRTAVAAQWVRRMTEHPDPSVRSKAVKMLTCLHVNTAFIERQLENSDARVRANAVEALWGQHSHRHRQLLEKAALDPHHRVSANALLGLFRANAFGIVERIARSARSSSPQHRAAIAWMMGKTGRPEFIPELKILDHDAEECVRSCAASALEHLRAGAVEAHESGESVADYSNF